MSDVLSSSSETDGEESEGRGEKRRDGLTRPPPSFCVCQGHPPPRGREKEQNQIVLIVVLIPVLE